MSEQLPTTPLDMMFRLVTEIRDGLREEGERTRQLTQQINALSSELRLLRQSFDSHAITHGTLPARVERVERFLWLATLIATFAGVVGGGIIQSIAADAISDRGRNQPRYEERRP